VGGWKVDRRKKGWQLYEKAMAVVLVLVLVVSLIQLVVGAIK
jgi:hypothetical protein